MLSFDEDITNAVLDIHREWKKSERCIKQAEQINNAVVFPAIKELRYAGRRLVDALYLLATDGDKKKALEYMLDAKFDSNRARHDAVDAIVSKIAIDIEGILKSVGAKTVISKFPKFGEMIRLLNSIRIKVATSRGTVENRDAAYDEIEQTDMNHLVELFMEMQGNESLMQSAARKESAEQNFTTAVAFFGVVSALIAFAYTLYITHSVHITR